MPDTPAHHTLRDIQERAALSKKEFARSIKFSKAYVHNVLAGKKWVSPRLAYHVQLEYGFPALNLLMLQARAQLAEIASENQKDQSDPSAANRGNVDEYPAVEDSVSRCSESRTETVTTTALSHPGSLTTALDSDRAVLDEGTDVIPTYEQLSTITPVGPPRTTRPPAETAVRP